jgi:uncharacterized protein (TIGR03086 family)
MEPTDQLTVIIPILTNLVDQLQANQLTEPTPCTNFDVSGVLDHMMGGAAAFAPAFRGEASGRPASTVTAGQVPAVEYRQAMNELLDAATSPGAMERTVDAPFGQVPGSVFASFVAFDGLIHGWDIAFAAGLAYDPPADVVAAVDEFARATVGPEMRDGDTFAVAAEAPAGASRLEQLVAFSGRSL